MQPNSRGWHGTFHDVPWTEIADRFRRMSDRHPEFRHMTDIVDSVLACGAEQHLVGLTSMHDLVVTTRPISEPPIDEVIVRAPSSLVPVDEGTVLIENLSTTGQNERIVRPTIEAVPLFWKFITNKLGISPTRPTT